MEQSVIIELLSNGGVSAVCIVAIAILAKYFYQYVKEKDKEKDKDKEKLENTYKEIIKQYIDREERYIEAIKSIEKFGDEFKLLKQYMDNMSKKLEDSKNA